MCEEKLVLRAMKPRDYQFIEKDVVVRAIRNSERPSAAGTAKERLMMDGR